MKQLLEIYSIKSYFTLGSTTKVIYFPEFCTFLIEIRRFRPLLIYIVMVYRCHEEGSKCDRPINNGWISINAEQLQHTGGERLNYGCA